MEPLSLSIMAAAAGRVLDHLLGDHANKAVAAVVGGVIGNHADRVVQSAASVSRNFFTNLRTQDPALNHDLERGTREAYLLATLELIRQAELRTELRPSRLMTAGDDEALMTCRRAIQADLRDIDNTLPERLSDVHLLAADPEMAPAERLERLREALRRNLARDMGRWLGERDVPAVVGALLKDGWVISTSAHQHVARDWYSLIAIAFVEKLKSTPRLAVVFESRLLAQIAARDPAAAPMASFAGFTASMDGITAPLQRIEDALGLIGRDIADIKTGVDDIRSDVGDLGKDVGDIKDAVSFLGRAPRVMWLSSVLMLIAAATVFATDRGTRAVCTLPGVRAACARMAIGGVPTAAEEAMWRARAAGNCAALRGYLTRFPTGAYAAEAGRSLEARVTSTRDSWTPQRKTLPFTLRTVLDPLPSEAQARTDALSRAEREAQIVCAPYAADEFRLRASRAIAREWRCSSRAGGVVCGFDGQVVCDVEARQTNIVEQCQ